jgi:RimJ/RimL family protein N-acetyltransferase
MTFPTPYRLEDAKAFISRATEPAPATAFAVATRDEAIGGIGLVPGTDVQRPTAEIGYWLAEPFWGKGIMTLAVRSLTDYAMEDLGMLRVFALPYTTNPASARVLEKAGFVREGILRANALKGGRVLDPFVYACVAVANRLRQDPPGTVCRPGAGAP